MTKAKLGRRLIAVAAVSTIIVPIGVDAVLFAGAHMGNPLWMPHAKLHCAMSFFAAISLGAGALALLRLRPAGDTACMAIATALATAFWVGLILAGWWPGATYDFAGDPAQYVEPTRLLGVKMHLNVLTSVATIAIGWIGFGLLNDSEIGLVDAA